MRLGLLEWWLQGKVPFRRTTVPLEWWDDAPTPQRARLIAAIIPPDVTTDQPFRRTTTPWEWFLEAEQRPQPRRLLPLGSVDDPPIHRAPGPSPWWYVEPDGPYRRTYTAAWDVPAAPVDDPPFGQKRQLSLEWFDQVPAIVRRTQSAALVPVVVSVQRAYLWID